MQTWKKQENPHPARLEEILEDGVVRCHLSPRNCRIRPGQHGFCMVRANRNGRLVSLNYGRSVHATEETIETEAVFHFAPGAAILSMGNIGCMLNCDYCHNWKTSQARYVEDSSVYRYTPEEVVELALRHDLKVVSWTYNDPVVWHEFVRDTSALVREAGLVNLYKSAMFISEEALDELMPNIDIFSVSIKSMDPRYYRRLTKGWIEPVLEATEHVYRAGKHVEISTLMVTDLSDGPDTAEAIASFVVEKLDPSVPTHFVRFHPDYKMVNTIRTPVGRLEKARTIALDMGLENVYIGNVYDTKSNTTCCRKCGGILVDRYGLVADTSGIATDGTCAACGSGHDIKHVGLGQKRLPTVEFLPDGLGGRVKEFRWHGDIRSVHLQLRNVGDAPSDFFEGRIRAEDSGAWRRRTLNPGESYRYILAKERAGETGVRVAIPDSFESDVHEVFDRAHFPVLNISQRPVGADDVVPFPRLERRRG